MAQSHNLLQNCRILPNLVLNDSSHRAKENGTNIGEGQKFFSKFWLCAVIAARRCTLIFLSIFKTNCTNMENCNNLTRFKKYCLDQLDYIYAAWNALSSYSEKLELKNKNLEEEKKTWEEEKKILEEENKVLKEENNILKEEKNLAYKKLEEMTQVLNTFINQNVKQRNIFEEIESPENVRRFL
ncbi:unnamed protein product [Meloidogyne enterolobii]|uniref:Uncharacterized protein n=1 Tax=Meloidogyne enterolobii TaxID=390850 RepID=A0ACB1AGS8_MELEN